jgi:hypothetical protein
MTLNELTEAEAKALVCLSASTIAGETAVLSKQEQQLARQWGGRHPYLLQLAASLLYEARQLGRDASWAKVEFEKEARGVSKPVWNFPKPTGCLIKSVAGLMILILIVLVLMAVLK